MPAPSTLLTVGCLELTVIHQHLDVLLKLFDRLLVSLLVPLEQLDAFLAADSLRVLNVLVVDIQRLGLVLQSRDNVVRIVVEHHSSFLITRLGAAFIRRARRPHNVCQLGSSILIVMGVLYIVSTPIGNLGDVTLRALETLRAVPLIVAEDTRHTRKLLAHNDIHTRLLSYNEHSPPSRLEQILDALGEGDVALVTDAGTPAVSDPGRGLVLAAHEAGFSVSALPGPSAVLTALVLSGMDTSNFLFLGFLPRRPADRRAKLREARDLPYTLVLFEAPHRIRRTLQALREVLGDRALSIAREMTKLHEEVRRGTITSEIEYWATQEPRGEYTLVVAGNEAKAAPARDGDPIDRVAELVAQGQKATEAVRVVARETGSDRRELYAAWLDQPQK